ncbi:SctD/MshK family protein [Thiolapillus sp.]
MNDARSLELVVVEGEQAGASTVIRSGCRLTVGATLDNDVVLRDSGLSDTQILLELNQDVLILSIASGEADLAGERLVAGDVTRMPLYTTLHIGNSVIACGESGSAHWGELLAKLQSTDEKLPEVASATTTPVSRQQPVMQRHGGLFLWLFIGSALLLALFGGGREKAPRIDMAQQVQILREQIQQLGFAELKVQVEEEAVLVIRGYLKETRHYAMLEALLEKHEVAVSLEVRVGEKLAAEVKDIYRVQGISAEVEALGSKQVKVMTREEDVGHLQEVRAIAIRDAGLEDIVAYNEPPEAPPEAVVVKRKLDPGEAVTMVVAGDPAYVVTTDQARYFIGSLLPTGHRIAAITGAAVLLEKEGAWITLNF